MIEIRYPQLDGVRIADKPLPYTLIEAIRRAFDYIQQLASSASGISSFLQIQIPATGQVGQKIYVTDYRHILQWDDAASKWNFAPEDDGSDYFRECASAPASNKLWHACNGATVKYLKSDGKLGTRVLPNPVAGALYAKLGAAYAQATVAAVVPTIAGATASGTAIIGNDNDPGTTVTTSGAVAVALKPHNHTDTGHTHAVGTLANTLPGDPVDHCTVLYYYRQ